MMGSHSMGEPVSNIAGMMNMPNPEMAQGLSPQEALLLGYLMGRGFTHSQSLGVLSQWRSMPGREVRPITQNQGLAEKLEAFMKDQISAVRFYGELAEAARRSGADPTVVEFIHHARRDEQKHYRLLQELYRNLTGRSYEATPSPVQFSNLAEGLQKALKDELEAAEEYRDTYLREQSQRVKDVMFELMTDELEHATRFGHAYVLVTAEMETPED